MASRLNPASSDARWALLPIAASRSSIRSNRIGIGPVPTARDVSVGGNIAACGGWVTLRTFAPDRRARALVSLISPTQNQHAGNHSYVWRRVNGESKISPLTEQRCDPSYYVMISIRYAVMSGFLPTRACKIFSPVARAAQPGWAGAATATEAIRRRRFRCAAPAPGSIGAGRGCPLHRRAAPARARPDRSVAESGTMGPLTAPRTGNKHAKRGNITAERWFI
jgi:hypothetical protein